MSFVRRDISTTSTFTSNTAVSGVSTPTFQVWENTTSETGKRWDLGNTWVLTTLNDNSKLTITKNGVEKFKITADGLSMNTLNLTNYAILPDLQSNASGVLARHDGDIYISEATEGGGGGE